MHRKIDASGDTYDPWTVHRPCMPPMASGGQEKPEKPIPFDETTWSQCVTPVSGSGAKMLVCGAPVMPGRRCCAECYKRLYVRVSGSTASSVATVARRSDRSQRMTVLSADLDTD